MNGHNRIVHPCKIINPKNCDMKKLFPVLAATLFSLQLAAQSNCHAEFQYTLGPCPEILFFSDLPDPGTTGAWYLWTFGDGTESSDAQPVHIYESNGTYEVCLVVESNGCTSTHCEVITINCLPWECEAYFQYTSPDCPTVNFYGANSTGSNDTEYLWHFGDGSTGDGPNPLHTYEENGVYQVCMVITYPDGCVADYCHEIFIGCIPEQCEAFFEFTADNCSILQFFGHTNTVNEPVSSFWDFGDGQVSTHQNPDHAYEENGWYTVCLVITTSDGCTATYCEQILIECMPPGCMAEFDYEINCPAVQFYVATASGDMPNDVYLWDFGDGTSGEGIDPVHTYEENGEYHVCLTVICENGSVEEFCEVIWIECQPPHCEAWFEYSLENCPTVEFWASDINIPPTDPIIWTWYFGDGTTGYGQHQTHTYASNGPFTVCLVVTTPDGCTAEFCSEIYIECEPRPCHALFDYELNCPAAQFFVVLPPDVAPGAEYIWDFGDGSSGYGWEPVHVYEESGSYEVCLTVICEDGSVEEYCQVVVINCVPSDCQAWFEYSLEACPTVEFFAASANTPADGQQWYWDFGDGHTGIGPNPEHTYCSNGTYTVCLIVITDEGCVSQHCTEVTVECIAPGCSAHFEYELTDDCTAVQFYSAIPEPQPNDLVEWHWVFGDGSSGSGPNPIHVYETAGAYTVCLVVATADGCTAAYCMEVIVECGPVSCEAFFEYEQGSCPTVQFFGLNSTDPAPTPNDTWHWDFGDGTTGNGPVTEHTYTENGIYVVCLTVFCSNGDATTYCEEISIDCITGYCDAYFEYSLQDCPEVQFYSIHPEPSGADDYEWVWDFGDGHYGEGPAPVHVYTENGLYTVCLTMICNDGTASVYCEEVVVDCAPPDCEAYFGYETEDCSTLQFFSSADVPSAGTYWHWEFGDGTSSDAPSPVHSYEENGVYSVCLTVVGPDGCIAVWCDQVSIECDTACDVSFDFSVNGCPTVEFFAGPDIPSGTGGFIWEFGDGSAGYGPDVVHTYTENGTYEVCLTVETPWNCTATRCEEVRIDCLRNSPAGWDWISTVSAYPNPVTERVTVEFEEAREAVAYTLSGMEGQEYQRRLVGDGEGFEVDLAGLMKGIYFLRIEAGEDSGTIKLLKF
jgi:PKD repeat protein